MLERVTDIASFVVAGINYRKSDASVRGQLQELAYTLKG